MYEEQFNFGFVVCIDIKNKNLGVEYILNPWNCMECHLLCIH